MRSLSDADRASLLRASAVLCATTLLLLPIAAQSSLPDAQAGPDVVPIVVPTVAPTSRPAHTPVYVRDPFRPLVESIERASVRPALVAYASGTRPVALVEMGGHTQALAIGVEAFGSRVTFVDSTVVRLADGRSLVLLRRP